MLAQRVVSDKDRARLLLSGFGPRDAATAAGNFCEEGDNRAGLLRRLYFQAGYSDAQVKLRWLLLVIFSALGAWAAAVTLAIIIAPLIPGAAALYEWAHIKRRVYKRAEAFERDYTALLLALASSVRTGLDPLVALTKCRQLFSETSEVRKELEAAHGQLSQGAREEHVILNFGASVAHPDIKLFRTAFLLARREGSSLAPCLQRLVRVTRQRQSFRRKARSAVALQRLSALGIALCAGVICAIQVLTNMEAWKAAAAHPVASRLLVLGVGLIGAGLFWLLRLSRSKI